LRVHLRTFFQIHKMKYLSGVLCLVALLMSCKNKNAQIVDKAYGDSLIAQYAPSKQVQLNDQNLQFWKNRINPKNPGQVNESRYASALIGRFHEFGDIQDVKQAESILKSVNKTYNNSLGSPFSALTASAMLQHHFIQADTLLQQAIKSKGGIDESTTLTLSFDVNFELGRYSAAKIFLKKLKAANDYNYFFRISKFDHYNVTIDSAISSMLNAADKVKTHPALQGIALSNAADLYIHAGNLQKAGELYKQCIRLNNVDFHSYLGLGWLALVHDKNDTLAEKIFKFVQTKNKLPDPLFKLYQMAQGRGDKALEKKYAEEFIAKSTDTVYGQMYNKYVIEIYTGILNNPAKAEMLAQNELKNRPTPQAYAWYAYTLFMNNKKDAAYKVFQSNVSGMPLEGLELYYMGKMMKGLGKGYNADEFFKAANKNIYDLSPNMQKDLLANLEE
jgi:hypothetical protein